MPFMRRMIHLRFVATIFIAAPLATAGLVFARVMPGKRIAAWYPIHPSDVTALPPVTLWVWERPEDLSPIDPKTIGVAFLARTVFLTGDTISFRPRPSTVASRIRHAAVDPNDMANHAAGGSWLPPLSETLKEIAGDETGYAPSFLDSPMQESVARDLGEALEYRPCA